MINLRPYLSSVLVVLAGTPFLLAADGGMPAQPANNDQPQVLPFQAPVDATQQGAGSGGGLAYQLQVMQQDMRDLRGTVEDLQHQIKQIQSTQQDRYLDLDKRIQNLKQQLGQRGGAPAQTQAAPAVGNTTVPDNVNDEAPIKSQSKGEKALYENALSLIRKRQYNTAITQLQAVIAQYPSGDFTANAYYWLGEVYAALPTPDYDKARQALAQVTTYFPQSRKVPDAMYKLGKVYFYMGDCQRAADTLNQVVKNYPGTSVANLAKAFLHDSVNCKS